MIRVIIERRLKEGKREDLIPLLMKLRTEAIHHPGYITGETLVNTEDTCNILVISTWQSLENWKAWDTSETRDKITQRINPLLAEPYTVRTYNYSLVREKRVWSTF